MDEIKEVLLVFLYKTNCSNQFENRNTSLPNNPSLIIHRNFQVAFPSLPDLAKICCSSP